MNAPLSLNDKDKPKAPRKALISTPSGEMVHLFTSQRVTPEPKLMEVDQFVQTQLDAGKFIETKM